MSFIHTDINEKIATVKIIRNKVNALNDAVVDDLTYSLKEIAENSNIKSVVLTGQGSFFSFGFDVPGFMSYPKDSFESYVTKYSELVKNIFMFPKPVIAAINGHAVAGGCVLAVACDRRIMQSGKPRIALNEMTFGSTLFSSVTEPLKYAAGPRNSENIIYSGTMLSAEEAQELGLVDEIYGEEQFEDKVSEVSSIFANKDLRAFASIKQLLKSDALDRIESDEARSISEFVDIWYSESTREQLANIEIR
ncbi:MAG: enoyl-CoA hydratase/isomerase family protein [Thermodesulfobacteriota bacterium]